MQEGFLPTGHNHKGKLSLNGLTSLSDKAAEAFAKRGGDLHLRGLTNLSEKAAEALSWAL
jgi:hypothetical protein